MIRIIFAALLFLSGPALADSLTYTNSRFGTHIELPMQVVPIEAPANGDGYGFKYVGLTGTISVYGQNSSTGAGLSAYRKETEGFFGDITYSTGKTDWFVLSGYDQGKIFYLRVNGCDRGPFHHVYFEFPENEKPQWQPVIEQYAKTIGGRLSVIASIIWK